MGKKYTLNVIGCGRLGKTIAFLLKDKVELQGILNRSLPSAATACSFVGTGVALSNYTELLQANLYLIATPDDQISEACQTLVKTNLLREGDIVFHCSGSLSSEVLIEAEITGAKTASIHPIRSFANPQQSASDFHGTFCAIEGNLDAQQILTELFSSIGGCVFPIEKTFKKIYHAAGVMASNYLVTLSFAAFQCYQKAGVSDEIGKAVANSLMEGTLKNLKMLSHQDALTGPIQRGDVGTISSHMQALRTMPDMQEMYAILGKHTLLLTKHEQEKKDQLLEVLEGVDDPNFCNEKIQYC